MMDTTVSNLLIRPTPIADIEGVVADYYHVSGAQLRGPSRRMSVASARQVAYYLARCRGLTMTDIGRHFGGRDHTTVLHGVRKVAKAVRGGDPTTASRVAEL